MHYCINWLPQKITTQASSTTIPELSVGDLITSHSLRQMASPSRFTHNKKGAVSLDLPAILIRRLKHVCVLQLKLSTQISVTMPPKKVPQNQSNNSEIEFNSFTGLAGGKSRKRH